MLKCSICTILLRTFHTQKEFWDNRAFSSATFSDKAELTSFWNEGFSLICSAEVFFSPPQRLQEVMGLITRQEIKNIFCPAMSPVGWPQGSWCADIWKEILRPDMISTYRQWVQTYMSLLIGGSLKRCPMDLRAGGGGDPDMACPGLHCSVWSWLSRTWASFPLLLPVLPSPWAGSEGSIPARTPYRSIPAGAITLLCRSRMLFLISSCCTGRVMMPNNV